MGVGKAYVISLMCYSLYSTFVAVHGCEAWVKITHYWEAKPRMQRQDYMGDIKRKCAVT